MQNEQCELPDNNVSDQDAMEIIQKYKIIAVVGISRHPEKPSHFVARYLKEHGYMILPVNNMAKENILGERVYSGLIKIPQKVEIVQIFRSPENIPQIVEDAITIGAKVIWMQEGIVNNSSAERARKAGLLVVMDKCMMKVHNKNRGLI